MTWFNPITGQTFEGPQTLEGALQSFNQSNFDVGSTVSMVRSLVQQSPVPLHEATLVNAVAKYGNYHKGLTGSGYTEGSNYRDIALRDVADAIALETGDPAAGNAFYAKWQNWSDIGRGEGQARTDATHKSDSGLGDLGILAAVAGLVTAGASLFAAPAVLGADAAGTAAAGWISAEGGAAYAGGLAADAVAAPSFFSTVANATSTARSVVSAASAVNTLTAGSPARSAQPAPRASSAPTPTPSTILEPVYIMANPLYNQDTMTSQQGAAPAQIGTTPPPPGAASFMGMDLGTVAMLAVAAVAAWAFLED